MKNNKILKKLIKDSVKEAIQEELKDILLEAIKSPKQNINESFTPPQNVPSPQSESQADLRKKYAEVMEETGISLNSSHVGGNFNPSSINDPVNGNLGTNPVGIDQIQNLLNSK